MDKLELLMRKLWLENLKFVDHVSLGDMCRNLDVEYVDMIRYLLRREYLVRIFRGVFYVKSSEEVKLKKIDVNPLEMLAKGLEIKGVKNWYFGLYTALRLNGVTHEYFPVDYVLNDRIFRAREMKIAGRMFRFIKVKPPLFFGIKKRKGLRYSDLEKTILDFIYLWRYRGIPEDKIILDISDLFGAASREKLFKYLGRYPNTVRRTLEMVR